MKKLYVLLAAVLLLSTFQPCSAAENNTYTQESSNGYIVKLEEPAADSVVLMENTNVR